MKSVFLLMFGFFVITGCQKKLISSDYVNWFKHSKENLISSNSENFIYEIRYISPEASLLMEFGEQKDSIEKYLHEDKEWSKFELKIFAKDKKQDVLKYAIQNDIEYYERLQYLIAHINQDIQVIDKTNKEVPCAFHHYERTYKITPFANVIISFQTSIENVKAIKFYSKFDKIDLNIPIKQNQTPQLKL
jgi:hypothetical protein